MLGVNEVAVATAFALSFTVLATLSLSEVGDRTVLNSNLIVIIILAIFVLEAVFGLFFRGELDVNVSNHVFSDVVDDHDVGYLSVAAELVEYFLVEFFEVLSCFKEFVLRNLESISESYSSHGVRVQREEQQSLA